MNRTEVEDRVDRLDDGSSWKEVLGTYWARAKVEGPIWTVTSVAAIVLSVVAGKLYDLSERLEDYANQ
jgi:hypothetical protein